MVRFKQYGKPNTLIYHFGMVNIPPIKEMILGMVNGIEFTILGDINQ